MLTACGGGSGGDASPTDNVPANTNAPTNQPQDSAIIFDNDPNKRLLFLTSEDGTYAHYFGETDAAGNLKEISRISYYNPGFDNTNPEATETSFSVDFGNAENTASFEFANGGTFEVKAAGNDYIFTVTSADGSQIYASTLNTLKAAAPTASASATATVHSQTLVSHRLDERIEIRPVAPSAPQGMAVHTQTSADTTQKIELKVSSQCGLIKDGGALAEITPDSDYANKNIAGKVIVSPPVFVNLEYSAESQSFAGQAPLSSLATDFDIVQKDALAFVQDQLEGKVKDLVILGATAAIGSLLVAYAPVLALPAALLLSTKKAQFALGLVKNFKKVVDGVELAWDLGKDVYKALKTEGQYFPISVKATYKGALPEKSTKTVVAQPGLQTAQLSLSYTDEQGATPKITKVTLNPENPGQHQQYFVRFSVNCLESNEFSLRASVVGTDGYKDSQNYSISATTAYELRVPGAVKDVRDEVTIELFKNGKPAPLDLKTVSLVFGA